MRLPGERKMIWTVVIACLFLAGFLFMRTQRRDDAPRSAPDTGLAILQFGHAYPNEAIREVVSTADGNGHFLRLHDGKVGFMRAHGQHFASRLIEPGGVRARHTASGSGLVLEFAEDAAGRDAGSFEFRTSADAAEVSLWLLGSLVPAGGIDEAPAAVTDER